MVHGWPPCGAISRYTYTKCRSPTRARTARACFKPREQGRGAVGRAQPLEHRVAELGERRERARRVRAPLRERGVTEHAIVVVEHERRDLVLGAEHGEILGELRDRHHLPEHADELPGAVQRHLVQERRRPLGGLPQQRPPRAPRLHLSRGKPFAHLGARGPVVAQRAQLAAAPSLCPARGVDDADVGYLGRDAERAEHEAVELAGAREIDAPVVERLGDPVGLLVDRAQARGEALLERVEQRLGLLPDQRLGRAPPAWRRSRTSVTPTAAATKAPRPVTATVAKDKRRRGMSRLSAAPDRGGLT